MAPRTERLRHRIERRLLALWFTTRPTPADRRLARLLAPLSWLAGRIALRRRATRLQRDPQGRPAVIVVGNLLVGGTGKTPAVAAIARGLTDRGLRVGVLAGGYRARDPGPHRVTSGSDPQCVGDEPVLLARLTGLPVASGRDRRAALDSLVAWHPGLDVVVSDDGLQHFGLPRRLQLAVFDRRGAGNGRMLPAGPLREPLSTAAGLDALLLNGTDHAPVEHPTVFQFRVMPTVLRRVGGAEGTGDDDFLTLAAFRQRHAGRRIVAVAGIADPSRFFMVLDAAGIVFQPVPLPDHARLDRDWLASLSGGRDDTLFVMTDKDAVKLASHDGLPPCWALEVAAHFDGTFFGWLTSHLPAPAARQPLLQD